MYTIIASVEKVYLAKKQSSKEKLLMFSLCIYLYFRYVFRQKHLIN